MGKIENLHQYFEFEEQNLKGKKTHEGSLHPQPEGRGIRDPPRSLSDKIASHSSFVTCSALHLYTCICKVYFFSDPMVVGIAA